MRRLLLKAGWAPVAVVLSHALLAVLIGHSSDYDPVFHFLGGAAIAYFLWQAVNTWQDSFGNPRPRARAMIVFCMSATAALFWEFFEFVGGRFPIIYSQASLPETMGDLILGCLGAAVYVSIRSAVARRSSS